MNKKLESAIWYAQHGKSVIPTKGKIPLVKWEEFQKRIPSQDEIEGWWEKYPDANVGIPTGYISGITVVDSDSDQAERLMSEYLADDFKTPTYKTPKGKHWWFKYDRDFTNAVKLVSDIDIRNDGGFVVVPPSNTNGNEYEWHKKSFLDDPKEMPAMLKDVLLSNSRIYLNLSSTGGHDASNPSRPQTTSKNLKALLSFSDGSRDNDLFHTANCLAKGGMDPDNMLIVLEILASACSPPFSKKDTEAKIKSAVQRFDNSVKNLAHDIRQTITTSKGTFTTSFIHQQHQMTSPEQKKKSNNVLYRLEKEGLIEKTGRFAGEFRILDLDCQPEDWTNSQETPEDIWLPFEMYDVVEIMPGDIILFAGTPNVGKTGVLMNIAKYNRHKFKVNYFSSELRAGSFKRRFQKDTEVTIDMLKDINFMPRDDNFHEVIRSGQGNLNIIDYMEALDEPYKMGKYLAQIYSRLNGAIAIIAIQKKPGSATGYGGEYTKMRPVLAVNMEHQGGSSHNTATIIKCKEPQEDFIEKYGNPNYMQYHFNLVDGITIIRKAGWHKQFKEK